MPEDLRQIRFRTLELTDLDDVMDIEPVAFGSHHWSRQSFINELVNPKGNYFAAVDETGRLMGYSGFWLIGEEAHITTLAVHPDFRRQYVGERLLINNILESANLGALWLTLEVRVSNDAAQQLYFKYGFRSLGQLKQYYQDNGEDALVLWTDNTATREFLDRFKINLEALGLMITDEQMQKLESRTLTPASKTKLNVPTEEPQKLKVPVEKLESVEKQKVTHEKQNSTEKLESSSLSEAKRAHKQG